MNKTPFLRHLFLATLVALPLVAGGCGDDDDDDPDPIDPGEYIFATTAPQNYSRVDRMGMPAVATAVISSKAVYNEDDPIDDVTQVKGLPKWAGEIVEALNGLHTALDEELIALGLTPATTSEAVAQATNNIVSVIPDVLRLNPAGTPGFPNGRKLEDPVIDVTLAVLLLDIDILGAAGPHSVTTLASEPVGPLNPPTNDRQFTQGFPYLAAAH